MQETSSIGYYFSCCPMFCFLLQCFYHSLIMLILHMEQEKLKVPNAVRERQDEAGTAPCHCAHVGRKQDRVCCSELETSFLWFQLWFRPGPCSYFVQYQHTFATGNYSHFSPGKAVPVLIISVPNQQYCS